MIQMRRSRIHGSVQLQSLRVLIVLLEVWVQTVVHPEKLRGGNRCVPSLIGVGLLKLMKLFSQSEER